MEEKPMQELTSTYFNAILRTDVEPRSVDDLPAEVVEEFNGLIRDAFTDEAPETIRRVRYLIPYFLQSIDWEKYAIPLEGWQLRYYYQRERFLKKTGLTYERFMAHEPMQQALAALHLEPEPTFEFILFLNYYYSLRADLRYSPVEQLRLAQQAMAELPTEGTAQLDLNIGGRHFKISSTRFLRALLPALPLERLNFGAFVNDFNEGPNRDKIRALDYYTLKTLLDFLPIARPAESRGAYTQAQRNFALSVLSFLGRLPDIDREGECSKENNATFDKLFRDFRAAPIPFAMELFL